MDTRLTEEAFLNQLRDTNSTYDVRAFARVLGWTKADIARYLERHPSTIRRYPACPRWQPRLRRLAKVVGHALTSLNGNLTDAMTWLRSPVKVLDSKSPKELIVVGQIDRVENLLNEIESGFCM